MKSLDFDLLLRDKEEAEEFKKTISGRLAKYNDHKLVIYIANFSEIVKEFNNRKLSEMKELRKELFEIIERYYGRIE